MNVHFRFAPWRGPFLLPSLFAAADAADSGTASPWFDWSAWLAWLEPTGAVLIAVALVLLCILSWATNLIALPGNWFSVALLAIYAWLGPQDGRATIGYAAVLAAFGFALVGELVEFLAGALGAQKAGASRRSTVYAVLGSVVGAVLGAAFGVPVPVIGSVLAAVLFAGVGAMVGAMYGEWSSGRPWRENWSIGRAAFWGRTLGTMGKVIAGFFIIIIAIAAVVI